MSNNAHSVPTTNSLLIGVFDSGVGGLSVLRALHKQLPHHPLLYVADSAHTPYGERTDEFVINRSLRIAAYLIEQGAQALVIACNTATAIAAAIIRAQWPHIPVIGIEPGIKPAVHLSPDGRIGIMATPMLLRSEKFLRLLKIHQGQAHIHLQACPGLASLIEQGQFEAGQANHLELIALIEQLCQPLKLAKIDTLVLGCTHYPFAQHMIQAAMGKAVQLIDTAQAVAQQTARTVEKMSSPQPGPSGQTAPELQTTANPEHLARLAQQWLPFACHVNTANIV
jgi:glutamate racemase